MTQTNIVDSSRTECNNGECVRITTTCIDGDCNEVRVVIPESEVEVDTEPPREPRRARRARRAGSDTTDEGDDESETDSESEGELCNVKAINFAIIFNGVDITLFFGIMCLIMFIVFIIGVIRIKNKK